MAMKRLWQRGVIALWVLYVLLMGYFVVHRPLGLPFITWLLPPSSLSFFAFSLGHAVWSWGSRRALLLLGLTLGITLLVESIGVLTGWVYGPYHYTDRLGPRLFGLVPPLIPLAWFMMIYVSHDLVERVVRPGSNPGPGRTIWLATLSALAVTAWDLIMDPVMVAGGHWVWEVRGGYFGIPVQNYIGWLATTFTIFLLFRVLTAQGSPRPWGPSSRLFASLPVGAYVATWLANVILALELGLHGPAVAGFFGMGSFALLGLGTVFFERSRGATL
jgi:putative membrane protein